MLALERHRQQLGQRDAELSNTRRPHILTLDTVVMRRCRVPLCVPLMGARHRARQYFSLIATFVALTALALAALIALALIALALTTTAATLAAATLALTTATILALTTAAALALAAAALATSTFALTTATALATLATAAALEAAAALSAALAATLAPRAAAAALAPGDLLPVCGVHELARAQLRPRRLRHRPLSVRLGASSRRCRDHNGAHDGAVTFGSRLHLEYRSQLQPDGCDGRRQLHRARTRVHPDQRLLVRGRRVGHS